MKTKSLLTAMALPLVFAACTQEDEIVTGNSLSVNREVVGNVNLEFNRSGEIESRFGWNGGYYFNAGDEMGACLMDEITSNYKTSGALWDQRFDLVNYIQTNYLFTRDADGIWSTEAKLLEGNYFFCFPYNVNSALRDSYKFEVSKQILNGVNNASLRDAYAKNNGFIGFTAIHQGAEQGEAQKVDMIDVFGATGIVLKNTGTNTYKIEKLVLNGAKVGHTATVTPSDVTATPVVDVFSPQLFEKMYSSQSASWYANNNVELRKALKYAENQEIEIYINNGASVAPQNSINTLVMLSPMNLTTTGTTDALLDIYTDKGIIKDVMLNKKYTSNTGASTTTNVLTDVALTKLGNGEKIVITFDDTSLDVPNTLNVSCTDELASLIHWNAEANTDVTATLEGHVNITKAMYAELASSKIGEITIDGENAYNVTIDADVPATALDRITFVDVEEIIVKGTQTLAKNKEIATVIVNNGTINIAGAEDLAATVTNNGVLNVNKSNDVDITNNGTMTVAAGVVTNGDVANAGSAANITNNGTILNLTNSATVTNNGTLGEATVKVDGIANKITNSGTIYNEGSAKAHVYTNSGNIYANDLSTTRVRTNNKNIIITELEEDGNFLTGTTVGNIVQEIAEAANTDAVDDRANTIWLSSTLTVEKKDAEGNYVAVDLNEAAKNGKVTIVAKGAEARINGNNNVLYANTIVVDEASKMVLNKVKVVVRQKDANNQFIVSMNGKYGKVSTLTINSNAALNGTSGADVYVEVKNGNQNYNIIDNNSSSSNIASVTVTNLTVGY